MPVDGGVGSAENAAGGAPWWLMPSCLANRAWRPGEGPRPGDAAEADANMFGGRSRATHVRGHCPTEERERRDGLLRRLLRPEVSGYYSAVLQCVRYIVATDFLRLERIHTSARPAAASSGASASAGASEAQAPTPAAPFPIVGNNAIAAVAAVAAELEKGMPPPPPPPPRPGGRGAPPPPRPQEMSDGGLDLDEGDLQELAKVLV